jgi:hypothetical protein
VNTIEHLAIGPHLDLRFVDSASEQIEMERIVVAKEHGLPLNSQLRDAMRQTGKHETNNMGNVVRPVEIGKNIRNGVRPSLVDMIQVCRPHQCPVLCPDEKLRRK